MKKLLLFFVTSCWLSLALAQNSSLQLLNVANQGQFQAIQNTLARADHLCGDFKQMQKIAVLSQPLISTGHFTLSKQAGLQWHQVTPFASKLLVNENKIVQQLGANPPTIITKEQQPIVFSFTNIFLAVFSGNTKLVNEYFALYFAGDPTQWQIKLTPLNPPLTKAITSINLSGGRYVDTITINDTRNNQIIMQFFNVKEM